MKFSFVLVVIIFLAGCGYAPSSKHARTVVGESISTSVIISAIDPQNTVIIKDGVDSAVIRVFHASLTTKEFSKTHLTIRLLSTSYSPIQYDSNGFVISYRTTVNLGIERTIKGEDSKSYTAKGTYDFSIAANAIISDAQRFEAIEESATKAIKSFVAQVSAEGAREKKTNPSQKKEKPIIASQEPMKQTVIEEPKVQKVATPRPTTSVSSRLDDLEKAYQMKKDGLLSDEEFKAMKNNILTK